jgi:hypothetical protein
VNNSLEIMMLDVQIDRTHSGAVCKAIGEGLSVALGPQSNELSPRLLALTEQLAKVGPREVPSEIRRDLNA